MQARRSIVVKLGRDKSNGTSVAIKIITSKTCGIVSSDLWKNIAVYLTTCQCEYVVSLLNVFHDDVGTYLVLERLPGVFCQLLVSNKTDWTLLGACNVIYQLLTALSFVHKNNLIHGDVSSGNILAANSSLTSIKLCGFAKCSVESNTTGNLCSSRIKAPEVLEHGKGNQSVDLWALGCFAYLLLTGDYPFSDKNNVVLKTKITKREPDFPGHIDENCKSLLKLLLKKNPTDRITVEGALNNDWILNRLSSVDEYSTKLSIHSKLEKSLVV